MPTFTHFLDLPILMLIVSLGALRPDSWTHFVVGSAVFAIAVGTHSDAGTTAALHLGPDDGLCSNQRTLIDQPSRTFSGGRYRII